MHTERLVSLYFMLMSAAVSRIASIASSSVTLWMPRLAIESCAAVTAFTAIHVIDKSLIPYTDTIWSSLPPREFLS